MTRCPKCQALAEEDPRAGRWLLDHLYRQVVELYHGRMLLVEACAGLPHREDPYRL